jgi:hypothetical protein
VANGNKKALKLAGPSCCSRSSWLSFLSRYTYTAKEKFQVVNIYEQPFFNHRQQISSMTEGNWNTQLTSAKRRGERREAAEERGGSEDAFKVGRDRC